MIPARKVGKENWQAFRTGLLDNRSNLPARRCSLALRRTPIVYTSIMSTASRDGRARRNAAGDRVCFRRLGERDTAGTLSLAEGGNSNGRASAMAWRAGCRSEYFPGWMNNSCVSGLIHPGGQTARSICGGNKSSALIRKGKRRAAGQVVPSRSRLSFFVTVPSRAQSVTETAREAAMRRILVVDDDRHVRLAIAVANVMSEQRAGTTASNIERAITG